MIVAFWGWHHMGSMIPIDFEIQLIVVEGCPIVIQMTKRNITAPWHLLINFVTML
jgi:hypothetical protein